jgi:outer membrane receptor protein involved in Fe transport
MKLSSRVLLIASFIFAGLARAETASTDGVVKGVVIDAASQRPVEYATVGIRAKSDGKTIRSAATDAKGAFDFEGLASGDYELVYGTIGAEHATTVPFAIDAQHRSQDLDKLALSADGTVTLEKVGVSARKEAFYNSIDRKVYNVGKEVQSVTGTASDLLKNIPSVQVDIEGNVSLRGDSNVLVLVNGKPSTIMGRNRAAVLEQMSADAIEKIEVITNPSAKYKPDGTAGIINLTLKRKQEAGYSGSVHVAVGNSRRANGSVSANFNPGRYNLYGTIGVRQDDRPRTVQDERAHLDAATNTMVSTSQRTTETSRPVSHIAQLGADFNASERTKLGAALNYNLRDLLRTSTVTSQSRDGTGTLTSDRDRQRTNPEFEKDVELTGTLQHSFPEDDRELSIELKRGRTTEQEDNDYANRFRLPVGAPTFERTLLRNIETNTEATADYSHPVGDRAKLELGYAFQDSRFDMDFHSSSLDAATNTWLPDPLRTNRFIYDSTVHAAYGTYARKIRSFGYLAGVRVEQTDTTANQVTTGSRGKTSYARVFPSLHLSYDLSETHQLQLNYSHRVHRPEGDDLNPFPEYQDPFNLRAGNPRLVPEEIHSIEAGWQYKNDETTYLATGYYRYRYHGMTEVARYIDATTLLTTKENLGISRAGGLELGATTRWKDRVGVNFSANVYRNEIDASNLGFSARRAATAWEAKLNASWDVTKATLVQFNSNYSAKRLTPQGYRLPSAVANVGLRHNLSDRKTALIVSLSDVFDSLKERTHIDTPSLRQDIVRRRSSRILYVGLIYNFGQPTKKQKNEIPFEAL